MALLPKVEDTELNMTPMIDIVFQLIVFFLLTLRFSSPEYRIDGQLPVDRGIVPIPQVVSDLHAIEVKVFRKDRDKGDLAWTKVRIGNDWEAAFPKASDPDAGRRYEEALAKVMARIRDRWESMGNDPEQKGRIDARPPDGPSVPHGDVVRVLDAFLQVGIKTVNFEGVAAPLPKSRGGHGP